MPHNEVFLIGSVALNLADFKNLSPDAQAIAFLRRLAHVFPKGRTFHRGNLTLTPYGKPDPQGLCAGWPPEDIGSGLDYLLKTPWRWLARDGYIAGAIAGHDFFEVTEEGWAIVNSPKNARIPDRNVFGAIRLLHRDLQNYEHYFREGELKEAVAAAFSRVENRLNEIRSRSHDPSAKTVSGVGLPYKLFETGDLQFPYPFLAAGNSQDREGYAKQLKGFLTSGIGWFRNSFVHEPHALPDLNEGEALELLFVASYMLLMIDKSATS